MSRSLNWYDCCELEVDGYMVRGGGGDRMKSGCVVILLLQDRRVLPGSPALPGAPACWCDACSGAGVYGCSGHSQPSHETGACGIVPERDKNVWSVYFCISLENTSCQSLGSQLGCPSAHDFCR